MKHLKSKILIIIAIAVSVVAFTIAIYAYISRISTRGEIEVSAASVTAETTYTASNDSFAWTYTEAGDTKQINITTSNQTGVVLHRFYNIQLASGFTSNENLLKAILVYYNDNFIGSLNDVVTTNPKIEEEYNFIGLSSNKTDNFKFELHQAARNSIFDSKDMKITISTFTENSDYYKYIFVNNETDFKKAIDDVNSGLFEEIPSIVLCSNLTLENSYTISEPVILYLNGSTLNGSLTINDTVSTNPNALLEVLGSGTFNVAVTLGANYDQDGAVTLVKNHIKDVLKNGLSAGSTTNVLGYYSFYGISVTAVNRCTYTSPNVIIANSSNEYYNSLGTIKINNDEIYNFKILGTKTQLIDDALAHMPSNGDTISLDLFLPTYIPSQNANITWTSSDESIITSTGRITAERLENASVTLFAEIKVNDTVITRKYTFKVSAHNNEINFYKLVQEISPIVINTVRNSQADDPDALYYLPIVNETAGVLGTYDYRTSFKCPTNSELFDWVAYRNIGLENITYSMSQEQQTNFDYITLTNTNQLYLNNITLNNYANITITGDFGNSETYSTNINISITVGSNTQLLEKAFTQVSEEISQISILGNILSTRISNGMHNEKGDFELSHQFIDTETGEVNQDYTIEYSGEADIISSITYNSTTEKYEFAINPEYFNEYETTVAFTATVYYRKGESGATSKSRTFYVTVPAALHAKDFGTVSIYNTTKYQVFNQLPANEKTSTTGYTLSGSTLTDTNLDYILLRDIVGDANYLLQYNNNDTTYLDKISYTSSNYCVGTETLSYQTASTNPTSTTDTQAYDFVRLIEWATGNTRTTASSVVSNTSALGSLGSKKANAEDYLNNEEIAVLKQYYQSCTSATDAEWNSLFSEVFNVAPGYIYTNSALLSKVISGLQNNSITWTSENYSSLFGKYMEILQRYAVSTTKVNANDVAPCQQQYNSSYVWYNSQTTITSFTAYNITDNATETFTPDKTISTVDGGYWYRSSWQGTGGSGGDGNLSGYYATSEFAADRTSYITKAELQVILMFWLNAAGNNLDTALTSTNLNAIGQVIANNADYYSGYSTSDFSTVGKAILNGFFACLEVPTYFSTDGVAKIIKSFYDKKNYDLPTYDGTTNTLPFVSSVNGNIPYVTNADNIKSVLSYFVKLKTLSFIGNANLAVFLSENGLATVFARTGLYNNAIETLTMKHVAHTSVNFDLTNIKYFTSLKELDLSNNSGIQSVNELVNVNRSNYTSVNIENIGIDYEYQEFAIDNIASPTCTVRYTNALGTNTYSNDNSRASQLADLSDFNKFITKNMYMTNVVYDTSGNKTTVTWRIDEGNEIGSSIITSGGNYPSISTIDEMNQLISPYYYCSQSFTYNNISFDADNYYKVYYENGVLKRTLLGECISGNSLSQTDAISQFNIDTSMPDISTFEEYEYSTTVTTSSNTIVDGTTSTHATSAWYSTTSDVDLSLSLTIKNSYKIGINRTSNKNKGMKYLTASDTKLTYNNNINSGLYFFFLDYDQVSKMLNNEFYDGETITAVQYYRLTEANKYYMCVIWNSKFYCVGSSSDSTNNDTRISLTNNIYNVLTISYNSNYLTFSNNKNLRAGENNPVYHSQTNDVTASFTLNSFNSTILNVNKTPFIKVNYKNGTSEFIDAYSAGYRVYKTTNATIEYVETESTDLLYCNSDDSYYMYYTGSNALLYDEEGNQISIKPNTILKIYANYNYPVVSRSRTYRLTGTFYTWKLWYCEESWRYTNFMYYNQDPSGYINSENIESVKLYYSTTHSNEDASVTLPDNETTRTNSDNWDDWSTTLTSSWQYDKIYFVPYISYVSNITSNNHNNLERQYNYYKTIPSTDIDHIFLYDGTTGNATSYLGEEGSIVTEYNYYYGYKLVISNKQLSWELNSEYLVNPTGDTMDSILTVANQHFSDYQYGVYYGRYYGYNGSDFYSELGLYYETGYVYRIMPNESNTAFTWVKVSAFVTDTSNNILKSLGTGGLSVGAICYSTANASFGFFYGNVWYKVVLDEKTNIVNLVRFNDVGFATNGEQTYTQLTNDKLVPRSGDYLGFSGTFTIKISALIRTYNSTTGTWTEYIKTYKLKFVGSLTS